jgi:hypothetical protein
MSSLAFARERPEDEGVPDWELRVAEVSSSVDDRSFSGVNWFTRGSGAPE